MKTLVLLVVITVVAYGVVHFTPADIRAKFLNVPIVSGSINGVVPNFVQSATNFLRKKLVIPQSPTAKRKQLIDELSSSLQQTKNEISKIAPSQTGSGAVKLPAASEIRAGIERANAALTDSERTLNALRASAGDAGVVTGAVVRVLDTLVPSIAATSSEACAPVK